LSYTVTWTEHALNAAAAFLKDDPAGLQQLFDSVDLLANDPRPAGSLEYGSPDILRLHSGQYRVLYEINDDTVTVVILHTGRLG
jgi:mRNA interferase RelE/StbE